MAVMNTVTKFRFVWPIQLPLAYEVSMEEMVDGTGWTCDDVDSDSVTLSLDPTPFGITAQNAFQRGIEHMISDKVIPEHWKPSSLDILESATLGIMEAHDFVVDFIRNTERSCNVDDRLKQTDGTVAELIFDFVGSSKFAECHSKLKLDRGDLGIPGMGSCSAYFAFTECMVNDGESIYHWRLRLEHYLNCYRSIGVVTDFEGRGWADRCYDHWLDGGISEAADDGNTLYFNGFRQNWSIGETIAVTLDYRSGHVIFSRINVNGEEKHFKTRSIQPAQSYYFGLLMCGSSHNSISVMRFNGKGRTAVMQ